MNEKTMQSEEMNIRLQESSANDGFEEIVSLRGANKVVKQGKGGKRKEVMFARPVFSRGEDGMFQKTEKINRFIPLMVATLGCLVNVWLNRFSLTPQILLGGMVSGLSSTGLYEAFRGFLNGK